MTELGLASDVRKLMGISLRLGGGRGDDFRLAWVSLAMLLATGVNAQRLTDALNTASAAPHGFSHPNQDGLFNALPYTDYSSSGERIVSAYADCLVRQEPASTGDYLRHNFGADEAAVFGALRVKTPSCWLSTYGNDLIANRSIRTAAIADAVRRRRARTGHL